MYTPTEVNPTVISKVNDFLIVRENLDTSQSFDFTKTVFTNIGSGLTAKGAIVTAFLSWDADTIRLVLDTDDGLFGCFEKPFGEAWIKVSTPTGW